MIGSRDRRGENVHEDGLLRIKVNGVYAGLITC